MILLGDDPVENVGKVTTKALDAINMWWKAVLGTSSVTVVNDQTDEKKSSSKWPTNSWVSVRHNCEVSGHRWRLQSDRYLVPTDALSDVICIECDIELSRDDILGYLLDVDFMTNHLGQDHTNNDLWDAIANA